MESCNLQNGFSSKFMYYDKIFWTNDDKNSKSLNTLKYGSPLRCCLIKQLLLLSPHIMKKNKLVMF